MKSALLHNAKKGAPIKAWNILGPFDFDVSKRVNGLTWFENTQIDNGIDVFEDILAEALPLLKQTPRENQEQHLFGENRRWAFLRTPEEVCAFGNFHVYNCFGAVLAHSVIEAGGGGRFKFKLVSRSSARLIVSVDGATVFDSGYAPGEPDPAGPPFSDYFFEADIKTGGSDFMICVAKMCRWTNIGFALICEDCDLTAHTAAPDGMSPELRQSIEDAADSIEIEREIYYDGDELSVTLDLNNSLTAYAIADGIGGSLDKRLVSGRNVLTSVDASIPEGQYNLRVTIREPISGLTAQNEYTLFRALRAPELAGREHFEERKKIYLDHLSRQPLVSERDQSTLYYVCAKVLRDEATPAVERIIIRECDTIRERRDCSDFRMQPLLRLLYWESRRRRLSDVTLEYMKQTVLGFKYWQDEPGNTVMYFSSENHRLLFHVAEFLAGQLYPLETFSNSRQNGLFHVNKARGFIVHWLQERGRYGFSEYHSNSYFNITLSPLLNIWEFCHPDDVQLRTALKQVIDYMTLILAANNFKGAFATAHSRTYAGPAKHPELENPYNLAYLLYGLGGLIGLGSYATFEIASGPYKPPALFDDISLDTESKQYFTWQQSRGEDGVPPCFGVYRTPHYQMSAMLDPMSKGRCETAMHTAHVGLPRNISVFWTAPWTVSETSGLRPSYWSGTAVTPRTMQDRNVIAMIYKGARYNWMTHCFFEKARFDRVEIKSNWAFGEVDGAYIGIWCGAGLKLADFGVFKGRELISEQAETAWVCECGDADEHGSFEAFMRKMESAAISYDGDRINYASPSIGALEMGWDGPVSVSGRELRMRRLPTVKSEWINGEFGSPHIAVDYKGQSYDIWMD